MATYEGTDVKFHALLMSLYTINEWSATRFSCLTPWAIFPDCRPQRSGQAIYWNSSLGYPSCNNFNHVL